jgi:hypothetical protein
MKRPSPTELLLPGLLVLASAAMSPASLWHDKRDNKSVAELELMNDNELAQEASYVCMVGAVAIKNDFHSDNVDIKIRGIEKQGEANAYLETIERVLRKAHAGQTPKWIKDMESASSAGNDSRCVDTSVEVFRENAQRAGEEAEKKARQSQHTKTKRKGQ